MSLSLVPEDWPYLPRITQGQAYPKAFIAQIVDLVAKGESITMIAKHYGMNRNSVRKWCRAAGVLRTCAPGRPPLRYLRAKLSSPNRSQHHPPVIVPNERYRILLLKERRVVDQVMWKEGKFHLIGGSKPQAWTLADVEMVAWKAPKVQLQNTVIRNYFYPVAECRFGTVAPEPVREPPHHPIPKAPPKKVHGNHKNATDEDMAWTPQPFINPIRRRLLEAQKNARPR
jgi:hypothetical protein